MSNGNIYNLWLVVPEGLEPVVPDVCLVGWVDLRPWRMAFAGFQMRGQIDAARLCTRCRDKRPDP